MAKQYDPRMHTAEHILNQTMDRMFGCGRCVSAHIEKKKSKCDYRFDRGLSGEEQAAVEAAVNDIIEQDLPVTEEMISRGIAGERFDLDRLPDSAGDPLRVVRVGAYDACPCIGDHVRSTKEIGAFRMTSTSFENGLLRIRYKVGDAGAGPASDPRKAAGS
ncbi:MAG: hypothetical protein ACOWWM_13295 [Desulfobacterales bacterium]